MIALFHAKCKGNSKKKTFKFPALPELPECLTKSLLSAKDPILCVSCSQSHVTLIYSLQENIVLSARVKNGEKKTAIRIFESE